MFLRIFTYRVLPQLRDRHLAIQSRAARLYKKHVPTPPKYFRRSTDSNAWVELHEYADRQTCQRVAHLVALDAELAQLWKEFQETLDPAHPVTLEEYDEYQLPTPLDVPPYAQPPIDAGLVARPAPQVRPVDAAAGSEGNGPTREAKPAEPTRAPRFADTIGPPEE
jgi:hypothetical protein